MDVQGVGVMKLAPAMFISHGAPTFAVDRSEAAKNLNFFGENFSSCRAVLVLSPHWITPGLRITASAQLPTIHDFAGFDAVLEKLHYYAPGDPLVAEEVKSALTESGYDVSLETKRGRDHGCWIPMLHLLPRADIPVLQLSMPTWSTRQECFQIGRTLRGLRQAGIAIIGSGSLTHNIGDARWHRSDNAEYVERVEQQVIKALSNPLQWTSENQPPWKEVLVEQALGRDLTRAHPSIEHYLPLPFVLGALYQEDRFVSLNGGIQHYALSMQSFAWVS